MQDLLIAASILAADFGYLAKELSDIETAGVDMIHLDIMDNHYVPNLSFGPYICTTIKKYCHLPIDVHLMAKPVDDLIKLFAYSSAQRISFHPEASYHIHRSLALIRQLGCQAGLAINPATDLTILYQVLEQLDFIVIMSVNPGFSGQTFITSTLRKIEQARALIAQHADNKIRLMVDGGINLENSARVYAAGADTFVLGSALFHSKNYQETVHQLRSEMRV